MRMKNKNIAKEHTVLLLVSRSKALRYFNLKNNSPVRFDTVSNMTREGGGVFFILDQLIVSANIKLEISPIRCTTTMHTLFGISLVSYLVFFTPILFVLLTPCSFPSIGARVLKDFACIP